jgi:dTDP-glucose 4,6-dehydratase
MKKVLITGASGFIGAQVLEYMLEHTDWTFTCLSSWRHKGNSQRITPYMAENGHRIRVITHDLTGPIPDLGDFNYILNLASDSHVDRSIAEPVAFIENNVSSTLQMLEYARKHVPEVFVQFSTDEVYGAMEHDEWDVLLPSNPYSASKAAQEMIAIAYWKTYRVPVVITNSNNIVGKGQDSEKFVPKIISLINSGQKVTIHTSNGLPGKRYYNPVENTADALLYIVNRPATMYDALLNNKPDRYNLSGGTELDNLEMAQLVAKILGKPLKYELVDAESVRPGYDQFYAKTDGSLSESGWIAPITLEEGLAWIKNGSNRRVKPVTPLKPVPKKAKKA